MTDRQRMFDYLDGVADGLNESRNDVADVLDKIIAEIIDKYMTVTGEVNTVAKGCLQIIDKYRVDEPVDESVDDPVVKPVDESEERA